MTRRVASAYEVASIPTPRMARRSGGFTLSPAGVLDGHFVNADQQFVVALRAVFFLVLAAGGDAHGGHLFWVLEGPANLLSQVLGVAWAEEEARAAMLNQLRQR